MSPKFNLTSSTRIKGIDREKLGGLLQLLEYHVKFPGSDIGSVEYDEGAVLHLYPPEESPDCVLSPAENFQVYSTGDDRERRSLTVTPFLEDYHKRTFLGLKIRIHIAEYVLHRIDKAHY